MPIFRLGILLPASNAYPAFSDNLLQGLRIALSESHNQVGKWSIEVVPVELGTDPRTIPGAVAKLYAVRNCHAVAGPVNTGILAGMKESLEMERRPFIATTVGANIARPAETAGNLFRVSLGYWRSSFAIGKWAAENLGRRAYIATTLLEAGYDANGTFYKGFADAGGSEYRFCVADAPDFNLRTEPMIADLRNQEPLFLILKAIGSKAIQLLKGLHEADMLVGQPVISSGYFGEPPWLYSLGDSAVGIRSCAAWAPSLDLPENRRFCNIFLTTVGRPADSVAVLGYDTGRLVTSGIEAAGIEADDPVALSNAFDLARFASPRGEVAMDTDSRVMAGPLYLRQIAKSGKSLVHEIIQPLPSPIERDPRLGDMLTNCTAGWLNEHLCT